MKRVAELDQITDIRNEQRRLHDDLRKRRLDEFMAGFTVITTRLKEMYQMITLGGDAELELPTAATYLLCTSSSTTKTIMKYIFRPTRLFFFQPFQPKSHRVNSPKHNAFGEWI